MDQIDAKEAVKRAKQHVAAVFADEDIGNLGLEELDYDDARGIWSVTIGFVRVWERPTSTALAIAAWANKTQFEGRPRTYKVVTVSNEGKILGIKNRDIPDVA